MVATVVDRKLEKQSSSTIALPHPSGPTRINGVPDSSQGFTRDCTCATASTMTRPRHFPSTIPAGGASYRSTEEALTCSISRSPVIRVRSCKNSSLAACSMLAPNPLAIPRTKAALLSAPTVWLSAFFIVPTFVVLVALGSSRARSRALKKYSSHHPERLGRNSSDCFASHPFTMSEGSTASSERKSIAVRDTVAGDANFRSSHSKMKFTFEPN